MNQQEAMRIGGGMLGRVRKALYDFTQVGVTPKAVEFKARQLIKAEGGELSFTKVPGYHWATCININEGIVHGIPISDVPFADGDLVTVDVGVYSHGYHTDAAFSKVVGTSTVAKDRFIKAGLEGLENAIATVKPGNRIGDISEAMESTLLKYDYKATRELTGHGVGKELHEDPMISNVVLGPREKTPLIKLGQTLAIEIIYAQGKPALVLEEDGWTISTKDGKLSAVQEETVVVNEDGCSILTVPTLFQIV
ncbi:type I methionyl aminopeptidase [Candidatus Collierbacteria bacterium CG10_big_fil_rev_8_21_14_0_10_44_9]|uniref:Methionine aminopeptidase n=1 Tax=Candidatus Collierbacteria bacterium CG10_big_fil_rev_8_21_14_0_10_44_9 TaxID=1974535 RepID=A0A2H0VJL0_9BACT|nr:MAG: type I methionyl aminopeptidase [Candidatus Collierbacteria bacterium CG10_big_fil_rev_8_21_14_0_10_44_9]